MANGYDSFADAMLAAINGPKDGEFDGEEWEPLQCLGCDEWFPVLKRVVDTMPGDDMKMKCQDCGERCLTLATPIYFHVHEDKGNLGHIWAYPFPQPHAHPDPNSSDWRKNMQGPWMHICEDGHGVCGDTDDGEHFFCECHCHSEPVADYRKARGAVPWHPPMLLPEDAIRLGRD